MLDTLLESIYGVEQITPKKEDNQMTNKQAKEMLKQVERELLADIEAGRSFHDIAAELVANQPEDWDITEAQVIDYLELIAPPIER